MQGELMLDQLWFTWSTNGLGAMPRGFRVRAASERFYDIQGMNYRQISRFLDYKTPQGVSMDEFSPNIAPISLSLVDNGEERLLIRKIYTGLTNTGQNGNFFTHLIAGLPRDFTARDAIRLWYCPSLWVESEEGKAASDKTLKRIPYSKIRSYADHPQASFNVGPVSEPLQNLLLLILTKDLPPRIVMRGHSNMIAPLIYGLTHTLPMKLLPSLTFTTYESDMQEIETLIAGTINGAELQDITRIQVQPVQTTGPVPAELQRYVVTAFNALLTNNTDKLFNVINEIDQLEQATVVDLIELFNWRFRHGLLGTEKPENRGSSPTKGLSDITDEDLIKLFNQRFQIGPLEPKQLEDTVLNPAHNLDNLAKPDFPEKAAQLLLNQPDYWERRGKQVFQQVVGWLTPGAKSRLDQRTQEALAKFIKGMVEYVYSAIRTKLSQNISPQYETAVLIVLAYEFDTYLRMLREFAQESVYGKIRTDALWNFQLWLLSCTKLIQPPPTWEQILPWLHIPPSSDKLEQVLKLDLPVDWEHYAIVELLQANREPGKGAYALAKKYEAKFTRTMQSLLIQGGQTGNKEWINMALRLFAAIIRYDEQDHSYPNRAGLLLDLLNSVPNDSQVIEALFALVPATSPYQLTMEEFDRVMARCRPEVLAAGGRSPSLMKYLLEYIFALTPKKLNANTIKLLEQFQRTAATLPEGAASLVNAWLVIYAFLANKQFDDKKLKDIEPALASLVPPFHQRGQNIWQIFIEELAPDLTALIETEYQLQSVLNAFEGARVISAWNLLIALAPRAGAVYSEYHYRLIPYMILGIREHARSGQPKKALDAYLTALFANVNDNTLGIIDKAVLAKVWPQLIQAEWKGWRERTKPLIVEKIRSVLSQQSKAQNEPVISRRQSTQQPERAQLPTWLPSPPSKASTPERDAYAFQFTIDGKIYDYKESGYQQAYRTLVEVLPFWQKLLQANKAQDRADSIAFEEKTMSSLLEELNRQASLAYSKHLAQYLVDNFLIRTEVERLCASGDQRVNASLNPENFITTVLQNFQGALGEFRYRYLLESLGEHAIKKTFSDLIRRNQLILLMIADKENFKGGWKMWLEQQRKRTKIQEVSRTSSAKDIGQ